MKARISTGSSHGMPWKVRLGPSTSSQSDVGEGHRVDGAVEHALRAQVVVVGGPADDLQLAIGLADRELQVERPLVGPRGEGVGAELVQDGFGVECDES
jgi:hypothetical protein